MIRFSQHYFCLLIFYLKLFFFYFCSIPSFVLYFLIIFQTFSVIIIISIYYYYFVSFLFCNFFTLSFFFFLLNFSNFSYFFYNIYSYLPVNWPSFVHADITFKSKSMVTDSYRYFFFQTIKVQSLALLLNWAQLSKWIWRTPSHRCIQFQKWIQN